MLLAIVKLAKLYEDLCIMLVSLVGGATCFAGVTDDATRHKWALFLKNKGHFAREFKGLATRIEKESGLKIQSILTDRGGEFTS